VKLFLYDPLANVDWLHGTAESFLTLSNSLIVLGFRQAIGRHRHTDSEQTE
jgi:hypothetical protein